jgi:hypothetical protein
MNLKINFIEIRRGAAKILLATVLTKQMKIRENAAKRIGEINAENDQWLIS